MHRSPIFQTTSVVIHGTPLFSGLATRIGRLGGSTAAESYSYSPQPYNPNPVKKFHDDFAIFQLRGISSFWKPANENRLEESVRHRDSRIPRANISVSRFYAPATAIPYSSISCGQGKIGYSIAVSFSRDKRARCRVTRRPP
jgi:hypothetical protein